MSFPCYEKYKSSGIEWLGDVPEHWEVFVLRRCLIEHRQGYYSEAAYVDVGVKLLRITDLRDFGKVDFAECPQVEDKPELKEFLLRESDFVFARTGGAGTFGLIKNLSDPVVYASYLIRFRFAENANAQFLKHFFLSSGFGEAVRQNIHGGVNKNIHAEDIKNQHLSLPPLPEQTQIATFLDCETAKIDELVIEQQRLIEVLKEKRQAVISHAVTRGLNPNVKLKPSGIEWLGDVPEHWTVIKLGLVSTFKGGAGFPDKYQGEAENEIPFFKVGDIINSDEFGVMRKANHTITEETAKLLRAFIFPPNTIVFAKVGAALLLKRFRELGQPSCIDNNMMGMTIRKNVAADFLLYVLPLLDFTLIVNPGAVPSINEGQISSQRIVLPPLYEQAIIVEYINSEKARFDTLTAEAWRAIDLLQERRTALISAAVTGKIDVRQLNKN